MPSSNKVPAPPKRAPAPKRTATTRRAPATTTRRTAALPTPAAGLAAELFVAATTATPGPSKPAPKPRRKAPPVPPAETPEPENIITVTTSPHLVAVEHRGQAAFRQPSPSASPSRQRARLSDDLVERLQRLHLVIDLDATFVSSHLGADSCRNLERALSTATTPEELEAVKELRKRIVFFTLDKQRVFTILRPGSLDFLDFASTYFKSVNVWSAGDREYVNEIVAILFPPHIARPGIVFHRDDCQPEDSRTGRSSAKARAASPSNKTMKYFSKPLSEFMKHSTSDHTPKNTLMLDDREDIAMHNRESLIHISVYEPQLRLSELIATDNELEQIAYWLLERDVIEADDIRAVDKSRSRIFSRG